MTYVLIYLDLANYFLMGHALFCSKWSKNPTVGAKLRRGYIDPAQVLPRASPCSVVSQEQSYFCNTDDESWC